MSWDEKERKLGRGSRVGRGGRGSNGRAVVFETTRNGKVTKVRRRGK